MKSYYKDIHIHLYMYQESWLFDYFNISENTDLNVELPGSDDSAHFKRFDSKCRDKESKEDVKSLLCNATINNTSNNI